MNALSKVADHALALAGINTIRDGEVVAKIPYAANVTSGDVWAHSGTQTENVQSWTLVVKGTGRFGTVVVQQEYVTEFDYGNAKVGDKWPLVK